MLIYSLIAWCSRGVAKIQDHAQKDWAIGIWPGLRVIIYNVTENM